MGRGNFYNSSGKFIYVEIPKSVDEAENYDADIADTDYQDLVGNIRGVLPESYTAVDKFSDNRNGGRIIAENGLCYVSLHDNEWGYALLIAPVSDENHWQLDNLAEHHIDQIASKVFDCVSEMYDCRVRDTAWTSSPYKRKTA